MKKDYMTALSRAARWYLPRQEAEDVIADYRDMAGDPPRPDEELLRDLGRPRDAIKPLAGKAAYYPWLAAFLVMAGCILSLGFSPTAIGFPLWYRLFDGWIDHPCGVYLAALGAVLALVWFRWKGGRKGGRLPRSIPILLAVCLVYTAGVLLFQWACAQDLDAFLAAWGRMASLIGPNDDVSASFYLSRLAMCYISPILALIGVYSLIRSRIEDRRWSAVYILVITAMLAGLLTLDWTGRMDITDSSYEALFRQMLVRCSAIAAAGLIGTGVALC